MEESNQFVNVEVLLRLSEVERQTGIKRSLIYKKIGDATFPRPTKLGQRVSVWPQSSITRWINSVVEGETLDARVQSRKPVQSVSTTL